MSIRKAEKKQGKLRLGLVGPTGSGKSKTALRIGAALAKAEGTKLGAIDSERNSLCLYAGEFDFDVDAEFEGYSPQTYINKINEFASQGYGVLIIDSLTHAWSGQGGALEMVDDAAKRSRSGNNFVGWREVTPIHNRMVDTILSYPGHVIVTLRSKMEYILEKDEKGRMVPRKVGMEPIQRDSMSYEFSVVGDLDQDHCLIVTKSRCSALADGVFKKPGEDVAAILLKWLHDGSPETKPASTVTTLGTIVPNLVTPTTETITAAQSSLIVARIEEVGFPAEQVQKWFDRLKITSWEQYPAKHFEYAVDKIESHALSIK